MRHWDASDLVDRLDADGLFLGADMMIVGIKDEATMAIVRAT